MKLAPAIAALTFSLIASTAHATPPDSCSEVAARVPGSDVIGIPAMFGQEGLLYSKDGGKTFAILCKAFATLPSVDSFGDDVLLTPGFNVSTIVTPDGHLLVGDFDGLWIDDGQGCNWRLIPELERASVKALAFDPHDPKIIYGITATGYGKDNGLFRVSEGGEVTRIGVQEPVMFYGLRVVALPGGGTRFYAFGVREQVGVSTDADGGTTIVPLVDGGLPLDDAGLPLLDVQYAPFYVIRYSDDLGETWISHDLGISVNEETALEAVDPSNPDRVVISRRIDNRGRGSPFQPDQVLVSEDRGKTFREWLTVGSVAGVSFKQDGTVFIADRGEGFAGDPKGLWRADSVLDEPEQIADYETWCVEAREDRLEVCTRFDWGTADPKTGAFTKLTSFQELSAIHSCAGFDSVNACRQELCISHCQHWGDAPLCAQHYPECATENLIKEPAAGAPDAGAAPGAKKNGCGCSTLGAPRLDSDAPYLDIFWLSFVLMCSARRALFTQRARRKKAKSAGTT